MRAKSHYYDTSKTLVVSVVLYKSDLDELQTDIGGSRLMELAIGENHELVNRLHALIMIANRLERFYAKSSSKARRKVQEV